MSEGPAPSRPAQGPPRRRLALVLVALLLAPGIVSAADAVYVGQSLWSAKHVAGVDATWFKNRAIWEEKAAGEGARVGIISTGLDTGHPDLDGHDVVFRDFTSDRKDPYDDHGFGTFLAGIVAGTGHFQWSPFEPYWLTGARGIAPDVSLVVAKGVGATGASDDAVLAQAVFWMLDPDGNGRNDDRVNVILLPTQLEAPKVSPSAAVGLDIGAATKDAVQYAIERGVIVVVSAGDDGGKLARPGDLPLVLTVGAVDRQGDPAAFNAKGAGLDVLAPGALVGPWPEDLDVVDFASDGYASVVGTGAAAAFAAGVVAVMVGADPDLRLPTEVAAMGIRRANTVQNALKTTAVPLGGPPEKEGAGMIAVSPALATLDKGADGLDWRVVGLGLVLLGGLGFFMWRRVGEARAIAAKRKKDDADE